MVMIRVNKELSKVMSKVSLMMHNLWAHKTIFIKFPWVTNTLQCQTHTKNYVKTNWYENDLEHFLPDSLLSCKCKWQVDTLQSHPVDFLFPSFPVPPSKRIFQKQITRSHENETKSSDDTNMIWKQKSSLQLEVTAFW